MPSTRSRFLFFLASSMLAGCGGGATHLIPSHRRPSFSGVPVDPVGDPSAPPPCQSTTQTGCTDVGSGLVQIGSVQVISSPVSFGTNWSSGGDGSNPDYFGAIHRFTDKLDGCVQDRSSELAATAFAMAVYIRDNASSLASAAASLRTYAGVYLIGGATAIEMIGAAAAVLTVGDWIILLGAVGLTALEVAKLIRCVATSS